MTRPAAILLLLCAGMASAEAPPWGTGESRGEDLVITLVTFGPGDDVASWFGHTALAVKDTKHQHERLYNYGMFDFAKFAQFALGRLEFWVGEQPVGWTLRSYAAMDRDVRVQELNLTPGERLKMARALADNVLPENRDYLYHHYNDNCATRIRDGIDRAIGGQYKQYADVPARLTLRGQTRRYSSVNPPMSLLLDFLMNDEIDRPIKRWDEAFLPNELERHVRAIQFKDSAGQMQPLEKSAVVHYASQHREPIPEDPPNYGPWVLLLGFILGGVPLFLVPLSDRRRWARVLFGLHQVFIGFVFGLPGLVLLLMWMITDHTVTFANENLFLANPLTFLVLPLGFMWMRGSRRAKKWLPRIWFALATLGLLGVLLKALPWFDQHNWRLIALILPVSLGCAAAFVLRARNLTALAKPAASS